ncbi:hypothetical protein BOMU111920_16765 [Bordetella muralis]
MYIQPKPAHHASARCIGRLLPLLLGASRATRDEKTRTSYVEEYLRIIDAVLK